MRVSLLLALTFLPLALAPLPATGQGQIIETLDPGGLAGAFLIRDPNRANVEMQLLIQSGEGDQKGIEGLPHYLEHLVWLSVAQDFPLATTAGSNAFTSQWITGYQTTLPPERLALGLETLMSVFETPSLDPTFMDEEIGIIAQEYETRQDGSDVEAAYRDSRRWLYTVDTTPQGLARDVLGQPADFETFAVADAVALHGQTHVPRNAILLLRGGISAEDVAGPLAALVGTGGQFRQAAKPAFVTPAATHQTFRAVDDRGVGAQLGIRKLVDMPAFDDPQVLRQALDLARLILSGSRDESLATPLYYEEFLVADLTLNASMVDEDTAALILTVEPEPGVPLAALEPRIIEVWQDIAEAGVSPQTLERTRALLLRERESQTPVDLAAGPLRQALFSREPWVDWPARNQALSAVTKAQVDAVIAALAKGPEAVRTATILIEEAAQ